LGKLEPNFKTSLVAAPRDLRDSERRAAASGKGVSDDARLLVLLAGAVMFVCVTAAGATAVRHDVPAVPQVTLVGSATTFAPTDTLTLHGSHAVRHADLPCAADRARGKDLLGHDWSTRPLQRRCERARGWEAFVPGDGELARKPLGDERLPDDHRCHDAAPAPAAVD
jgi:hypothetical protein